MAVREGHIEIRDQDISFIENITLEPLKKPTDPNHVYVKFTAIYDHISNRQRAYTRYEGISREDDVSFFYKLNHLVYRLEKKNIQDIIHLRGINRDIYNVLNYLFKKYKKDRQKLAIIINFLDSEDNFIVKRT